MPIRSVKGSRGIFIKNLFLVHISTKLTYILCYTLNQRGTKPISVPPRSDHPLPGPCRSRRCRWPALWATHLCIAAQTARQPLLRCRRRPAQAFLPVTWTAAFPPVGVPLPHRPPEGVWLFPISPAPTAASDRRARRPTSAGGPLLWSDRPEADPPWQSRRHPAGCRSR